MSIVTYWRRGVKVTRDLEPEVEPEPELLPPEPEPEPPPPASSCPHLTVAEFRTLIPGMTDPTEFPDEDIQRWIDQAKCNFNPCVWGCSLKLGEAYWIAHQLGVAKQLEEGPAGGGATTAAIASKKVGDTSITYVSSSAVAAASAAAENPYLWTKYGQLYMNMLNSLPHGIGIMVV